MWLARHASLVPFIHPFVNQTTWLQLGQIGTADIRLQVQTMDTVVPQWDLPGINLLTTFLIRNHEDTPHPNKMERRWGLEMGREAGFDWSYSDQAQYDVIAKKGCHWSRTGIGAREVPATGPGRLFPLATTSTTINFRSKYSRYTYFPRRFACHALLSRSMTVRAHLVSLYIEFTAVSIYCYAF